jgi:hypothetical protein
MTHDALLALPEIVGQFNGFYTRFGMFVMVDQNRVLGAMALVFVMLLAAAVWGIRYWIIRRRQPDL